MGRHFSVFTNCFRIIFILLNCFFLLLGAGLTGVGGWLIHTGETNDYSVLTGHSLVTGAALLLTAGVLTICISAIGILGACGMWRPLLFIYIMLVVLIALVEIAAGITGVIFRDQIGNNVRDRVQTAVEDYRPTSSSRGYRKDVNNIVDYVQKTFECCGINSSVDWFFLNPNVTTVLGNAPPRVCWCQVDADDHCAQYNFSYIPPGYQDEHRAVYQAWNRGCISYVRDHLDTAAIFMAVLGFVVAFIELFGVATAIGLFVCIAKRNNYAYV